MKSNTEHLQNFVGKTIIKITEVPMPKGWTKDIWAYQNSDGFIITFDDGSKLTIEADMGQGMGFVVIDY